MAAFCSVEEIHEIMFFVVASKAKKRLPPCTHAAAEPALGQADTSKKCLKAELARPAAVLRADQNRKIGTNMQGCEKAHAGLYLAGHHPITAQAFGAI